MLARFAPEKTRGRVYGFHRAMDHAGAVAGPLVATAYLYVHPAAYRALFAWTLVPGLIVLAILIRLPDLRIETAKDRAAFGADIVTQSMKHVHVSGHGAAEELKLVLTLVRPTYFIPVCASLVYKDSVEVDEQRYPIHVYEQALIPDSEGAGRHRGGLGCRSVYGPKRNPMAAAWSVEAHHHPPKGVRGGEPSPGTATKQSRFSTVRDEASR